MTGTSPPSAISAKTYAVILDLLEFCEQAAYLVSRGKPMWDSSPELRWAGEAVLHRIGEAVDRLDASFLENNPAVPWRAIRATRNIIAHEYQRVDYDILWAGLD
jgi:uncharacterized protein with HEPN domain